MSHGKKERGAPPSILQRRTNHDLPEEIVLEILAKQPVKSLLRFRCVCKRWYSSMANPSFISTHLSNNHHNQGLVLHLAKNIRIPSSGRLDSQVCTLARDRTFETISKFPIPFTFNSWFLVLAGSCNGILCFSDYMKPGCNDVYLWNPSIRMFKRLPDTCLTQLRKVALGFGYDSQTNDYKVVKFSSTIAQPMPPPEVEVYSLSSDSWKRIELGISWRPNVVSRNFNFTLTFPVVSGHLHWMIEMIEGGGGQEGRSTAMILSFDLNSEKFKELPLPDEEGSCIKKGLTSFKEKLALIKFGSGVQPHSVLLCSIWVMREYGVFDSWNKLCVLPIQILTDFIGFTKHGALIRKKTWLVAGNGVLKSKDKCVLIDPETLHEKEIITQADSQLNVATYMENLTLLDGQMWYLIKKICYVCKKRCHYRLEKLYGGKVYVGLRIPDADTGSRQNIDMVLVNKGEAVVISVKNISGFVSSDGSWVCEGGSKHKAERFPDPVAETKKQASILESYLEQRGVALPEGYFSCKVVLPNPKFRTIQSSPFPSEVITYDQWVQLKPEPKCMFSGWIKGAFRGGKKEMQESIHQKLNFTLSTAPMWDRLELKGNKYVLGEFLDFKGKQEDINDLKNIRRSKVSCLIIQKMSVFGLAHSKLQVMYSPRDYRSEGASGSEWKEVAVRSSTEVLFQPDNSTKVRKFKLSSVASLTLSA